MRKITFEDMYVEWIKKTPDKIWSKNHANYINFTLMVANEWAKGKTKQELLEHFNSK